MIIWSRILIRIINSSNLPPPPPLNGRVREAGIERDKHAHGDGDTPFPLTHLPLFLTLFVSSVSSLFCSSHFCYFQYLFLLFFSISLSLSYPSRLFSLLRLLGSAPTSHFSLLFLPSSIFPLPFFLYSPVPCFRPFILLCLSSLLSLSLPFYSPSISSFPFALFRPLVPLPLVPFLGSSRANLITLSATAASGGHDRDLLMEPNWTNRILSAAS